MDKYILVHWPESQEYNTRKYVITSDDNSCFVPESIYYTKNVKDTVEIPVELYTKVCNFISTATFELNESFNPENLDDLLLKYK